jgi:hypothetical protein
VVLNWFERTETAFADELDGPYQLLSENTARFTQQCKRHASAVNKHSHLKSDCAGQYF